MITCRGAARVVRRFFEECREHQKVLKSEHMFQTGRIDEIAELKDPTRLTPEIHESFLAFIKKHDYASSFIYMTLMMEEFNYPDSSHYKA